MLRKNGFLHVSHVHYSKESSFLPIVCVHKRKIFSLLPTGPAAPAPLVEIHSEALCANTLTGDGAFSCSGASVVAKIILSLSKIFMWFLEAHQGRLCTPVAPRAWLRFFFNFISASVWVEQLFAHWFTSATLWDLITQLFGLYGRLWECVCLRRASRCNIIACPLPDVPYPPPARTGLDSSEMTMKVTECDRKRKERDRRRSSPIMGEIDGNPV